MLKTPCRSICQKLINETLFEVEVNTDINKQYLEDNSTSILSYLREKLQNDDVAMTIKIAEGNAIKKPLTSAKFLTRWQNRTPHFKNYPMNLVWS